jgi:hypothetical protein
MNPLQMPAKRVGSIIQTASVAFATLLLVAMLGCMSVRMLSQRSVQSPYMSTLTSSV